MKKFLEPFLDGDPPFLLSEGFPAGYLPLPLFLKVAPLKKNVSIEDYRREKHIKKVRFVPETEFRKACEGQSVEVGVEAVELVKMETQLHAQINRGTGTTRGGDEESGASLYQVQGWVPTGEQFQFHIYVGDRSGNAIEQLSLRFHDLSLVGFGKKKSSGMGAFSLVGDPEEWSPPSINGQMNGFVSLSGFVPSHSDPTKGLWQTRVKHGKLGESYAGGGRPFKKPWIYLDSGSCFFIGKPPQEVYGRMLTHLSEGYPEVVQYGYALPIPVSIPSDIVERL